MGMSLHWSNSRWVWQLLFLMIVMGMVDLKQSTSTLMTLKASNSQKIYLHLLMMSVHELWNHNRKKNWYWINNSLEYTVIVSKRREFDSTIVIEYSWEAFLTMEQGVWDKNSGLEFWDKGSELEIWDKRSKMGFWDEGFRVRVLGTKVHSRVVLV